MNRKVLCVDDDARILTAYQRNLGDQFDLDIALSGPEALQTLEKTGPYAVVVADMQMPLMNGVELLMRVEKLAPNTVRIMLTGNADQQTAVDAVNQGHVYRFLNKPCPPDMLALALDAGVRQYHLIEAERDLLENTLNGAVKALTDILGILDPSAFARAQRLRELVRTYVNHFKLANGWTLEMAAMLARVGCVAVPPPVLLKARSGLTLRPEEQEMLARVPQNGAELLGNIPRLETVSRIVQYCEQRFDGTGFPRDGVAGEDIPVGARILKVLSDLLELESRGASPAVAIAQMQARAGWYDPQVLDSVAVCFDVAPASTGRASRMVEVRLRDLHPGQELAAPITTADGNLIMAAGTTITPMALEKLRNFNELHNLVEPFWIVA